MTDPGNTACWYNFPWLASLQTTPMQYEHFRLFDHFVLFETLVNVDEHQDQLHPLDIMLSKVGIDPSSVDPKLKVMRPNFTWLEAEYAKAFQNTQFGMYQLCSANPIRSLPPNDSAFLLTKIADRYPNHLWLALYDEFNPGEYVTALNCPACQGKGEIVKTPDNKAMTGTCGGTDPYLAVANAIIDSAKPKTEICVKCRGSKTLRPNINLMNAPKLRELWALTTRASVVIAPDSMMVHVAGSMGVPCVGLWGLCNPINRVLYYKNHIPVWKKEVCPFSPCYSYGGTFPRYCPPRQNRQVCECLGAIAPENVLDAVKNFIKPPPEKTELL